MQLFPALTNTISVQSGSTIGSTKKPYGHLLLDVRAVQCLAEFFKRYHAIAVLIGFDYRPFRNVSQLFFAVAKMFVVKC